MSNGCHCNRLSLECLPLPVLQPVVEGPEAHGQREDVGQGAAEVEGQVELRGRYRDEEVGGGAAEDLGVNSIEFQQSVQQNIQQSF